MEETRDPSRNMTPEELSAYYARPENSQQQASPERIAEWVKNGGSLFGVGIHYPEPGRGVFW